MLQHGGAEVYSVKNLFEDYSVTTNFMGPSKKGLDNIINTISSINHYPPIDKKYFSKGLEFLKTKAENIIWGNGASELIDLTIRYLKNKYNYKTFTKGEPVQFMEYERSCINTNLSYNENNGQILIIINPNNPTGTFLKSDELIKIINEKLLNDGTIIIDESMIFWLCDWENYSCMFNKDLQNLLDQKNAKLLIVQSWTKIFSCTGLRFGSIWSNNINLIKEIESYQVPWSVNILSYHYLNGCLEDKYYLSETRKNTSLLRKSVYDFIKKEFPFVTIYGEDFLSWLWIDFKSEDLVQKIYNELFNNGIVIRLGKIGYKQNTFIRLGVRDKYKNNYLFELLINVKKTIFKPTYLFPIDESIVYGIVNINASYLLKHENIIPERKKNLQTYLENNDYFILPSIIVCSKTLMIIDGHHRFDIYKERNINEFPVLLVNYENKNIITHSENPIDKEIIIKSAINKELLPPKSTKHIIRDLKNRERPLISLSILLDI